VKHARSRLRTSSLTAVLAALLAAVSLHPVGAAPAGGTAAPSAAGRVPPRPVEAREVCGPPAAMAARCLARAVWSEARPQALAAPTGLSPATVKSVYGFPTAPNAGAGKTIAVVVAYDNPRAELDLLIFSLVYGLPLCTTANGCFRKVNQTGGTTYPPHDPAWALEAALDVQWAHAIAPGAKILLVEANAPNLLSLLTAEDYARRNAHYVSNSWGTNEFSLLRLFDGFFTAPNVSVFAASGDSGVPALWPSVVPAVVSVGGTTLQFDSAGAFVSETGWPSGGGGCSMFEPAAAAQASFGEYAQVQCGGKRATPDLSYVADPGSGVSVFHSTPYEGMVGWFTLGGTSAAAPIAAGRAAATGVVLNPSRIYGSSLTFRDVTSGNNGAPCLVGYDLCSGRGSWIDTTP
jgi:subtilase family serine protease